MPLAVGCRLSYGPVLRCASCRATYELSLALVVAVDGAKPYVAPLLGRPLRSRALWHARLRQH